MKQARGIMGRGSLFCVKLLGTGGRGIFGIPGKSFIGLQRKEPPCIPMKCETRLDTNLCSRGGRGGFGGRRDSAN